MQHVLRVAPPRLAAPVERTRAARCKSQLRDVRKEDGTSISCKDSMLYLGSLLAADGKITSELGRRIGMAQSDFRILEKVWKHSTLNRFNKIQILTAAFVQS